MTFSATYSPEDNKLRLYASQRLPADVYKRVREAGFIWAPKQDLFVAPMWTPEREDLCLELAGAVEDEDKGLVERAEERSDRFQDYSQNRAEDASQAKAVVDSICEHIPLGQPILVGHHSERHARKDAERIENGMRKAVQMWEQSEYWKRRAAGAIRAAKYKERPDVRARRIKKLEAEERKQQRTKAQAEKHLALWTYPKLTLEIAREMSGHSEAGYLTCEVADDGTRWHAYDVLKPDGERYERCPAMTLEQVQEQARLRYPNTIAHCNRWLAHYANRLAYERAMLAEDGGAVADRNGPEVGGGCRCWASRHGWSYIQKVNKVSVTILDNWGNGGRNFTRTVPFDQLGAVMSKAEVEAQRAAGQLKDHPDGTGFNYLADKPKVAPAPQSAKSTEFDAMRDTLKAGVQVVSAPTLFPTPPDLAARMVELAFEQGWGVQVCAEMNDRCRILEPSAGTGNILAAIVEASKRPMAAAAEVVTVEINRQLSESLSCRFMAGMKHVCADFLACNGDLGKFDRILMNPPFDHGSDIKHIKHALTFLNPGGRLVAICANGPKQQEELQPLSDQWLPLPAGTFDGTNVSAALIVIQP